MHGVNRDAERYRDEWIPHARKYGFILVAPEFSKDAFSGEEKYNLGNVFDEQQRTQPREQWTFGFLEPVFDAVKHATGNRSERYHLYGHSAGAQFVHRYLYFMPQARVAKAVAANAGWWTLPDLEVDFPYGLRGSTLNAAALKAMFQRPLVVLLGTADTDPNHVHLRRTAEALEQGPHRFARGQFFYAAGRRQAVKLDVPLAWELETAPGVGHSDKGMAEYAVRCLFGQPTITSRSRDHVRVLFGGDTSGGESYQDQYAKQGETNVLLEKGYDHGTAQLDRLLAAADYRVINLETPLTTRRDSPLKTKDYLHYSDPVKLPALFTKFGPVAFSLANNHTLDHGPEGLDDTRAALNAAGVDCFGAGANLAGASRPLLQEFRVGNNSVSLAVFGAFEFRRDYDEEYHFYAGEDRPGAAPIDTQAVKQEIAKLRRVTPNVFVVYFVHWGGNYEWKKSAQTATARALRDAGVDLVVGHGAHMLQEVEHDDRGWIFYSIGNFLFNARGRYTAHKAPPYSLPLVVDLSMAGDRPQTRIRAYPIVSDNQVTGYQPRFVTEAELSTIDSLLAEKSGWDAATRAAVKPGKDECGPYLEFTTK
jgi:UDP-N-acetylmuramoyl-tripeptide--D-alanyl-D-alanine ligase/cyanophycin synthetase/poly-gamma-glutamate synthesis protein (capsule biosynthesis protein)